MPEQQQNIGAEFLRRFVKQVCITLKKHENAEYARDELKNQIKKVKLASISQKKWLIDKEIFSLEKKIDDVLKQESALMGIEKAGNFEIKELKKNIESLQSMFDKELSERQPKKNIDTLKKLILELNSKIDKLIDDKTAKERRVQDIEQKTIKRKSLRTNAGEMKKKLHELEEKYNIIKKKSPNYNTSHIEKKINILRNRLKGIT